MVEVNVKKNNGLISVIVPVYNVEKYLEKCVCSILNQTYRELEIILIDDGSTDSSGQKCDDLSQIDNRIRVVHKSNGGLSDARNAGLEICTGDYIGFVDSDDWIHPQMYEMLLSTLVENNSDIAVCQFERADENVFESAWYNNWDSVKLSRIEAFQRFDLVQASSCNKLYRTDLFARVRYPQGKLHEDEYVIHRLLWECNCVSVVNCPLYYYFDRAGGIMSTRGEKSIKDALGAYLDRVECAKKSGDRLYIRIAISQFSEYCIGVYFDILNGKTNVNKSKASLLLSAERSMLKESDKSYVDLKYKVFSASPVLYSIYIKGVFVKDKIIEYNNAFISRISR